MANSYLISDWVTMIHDKRNNLPDGDPFTRGNFDNVVNTILDLTKEYFKHRYQQHLPISFAITCIPQEDDDNLLICDFRIIQHNNNDDDKKFYRCLSHISRLSMSHVFNPGIVWVAAELKQTIKLTLDPSM